MVLPNSHGVPRVPQYLGVRSRKSVWFDLQDCHLLWCDFPDASTTKRIGNFPTIPEYRPIESRDPEHTTLPGLACIRFGLFPVRSPLLGKSLLFSFPEGTKMFQFPSFASSTYGFSIGCHRINHDGFPHSEIPGSMLVRQLPEAYRSLPRLSSPLDT